MRPDLTLLFDIEAASGIARARGRNNSHGLEAEARFENEELAFHERVRQGYLALVAKEPERFQVLDASSPVEAIQAKVRKIIDVRLRIEL